MNLLILGGTRFLGRHLAQQALDAGHQVTLLHRGRSGPDLFPQAEHLLADRDTDLSPLAGRSWDAAIDTNAYVPRQVHAAATALGSRVGQYQLVSTISVYADDPARGDAPAGENALLQTAADPSSETVTGASYGGLKVLCEEAAAQHFGQRCLVVRPGLLVGPHDPTGRLTWWARRLQRAAAATGAARTASDADVLAPGDPAAPMQCLDARDAAAWMLRQAERGDGGGGGDDGGSRSGSRGGSRGDTVNLNGPAQPATMLDLLAAGCAALAPAARLRWVVDDFLLAQGVAPWTDLPLWLPLAVARQHQVRIERGLASGLHCRSLAQTFADTAAWAQAVVASGGTAGPAASPAGVGPTRPAVGLTPAREAGLLAAWHAHAAP